MGCIAIGFEMKEYCIYWPYWLFAMYGFLLHICILMLRHQQALLSVGFWGKLCDKVPWNSIKLRNHQINLCSNQNRIPVLSRFPSHRERDRQILFPFPGIPVPGIQPNFDRRRYSTETELKRQPRIFIIFEKIASYSFFPLRSVGIFLSSRVYFVSEMNKTRCIFIQIFKSEFYRRFGWCSIAKFSSAVFVANSP